VSNHVFGKVISALRALAARLGEVASASWALVARPGKEGSRVRKHGPGLLLWVARLIIEFWVRSRW
jgi:hypothetical protein